MTEFTNNLSSFSWWLGVVLVGLLINLASAYLKSPVDNLGSKIFTSWRERSICSLAKFNAEVNKVIEDPDWRSYCYFRVMKYRSHTNGWLICLGIALTISLNYKVLTNLSKSFSSNILGADVPSELLMNSVFVWFISCLFGAIKSSNSALNLEQILDSAQKKMIDNKIYELNNKNVEQIFDSVQKK